MSAVERAPSGVIGSAPGPGSAASPGPVLEVVAPAGLRPGVLLDWLVRRLADCERRLDEAEREV